MNTICIVVTNSLKKDPRVIKQIKTAFKFGYDVVFIGLKDEFFDQLFLDELKIKYHIIELPNKYKGKLKTIFGKLLRSLYLFLQFKKTIQFYKPKIVHSNDFDVLIPSYFAAKRLKCKIIYDTHEIWIENNEFQTRKIYKKVMFYIEKYLIRRVDKVISVSQSSADYLHKIYKIIKPIVITNCPLVTPQSHLFSKGDKFEVLYHGLITANRGYEELVLSSRYVNDNIAIVLRGYGSLEQKIKSLITEYSLQDKVTLANPVEIINLVPYAAHSNVGVVLTKPTNLNFSLTVSNKIFEYVHAGLPVIMSDIPEHRLLNEKYHFGLIIDNIDPESISIAISKLYNETQLYESLVLGAKKMASEMNWETEEKKLLQIYREI